MPKNAAAALCLHFCDGIYITQHDIILAKTQILSLIQQDAQSLLCCVTKIPSARLLYLAQPNTIFMHIYPFNTCCMLPTACMPKKLQYTDIKCSPCRQVICRLYMSAEMATAILFTVNKNTSFLYWIIIAPLIFLLSFIPFIFTGT